MRPISLPIVTSRLKLRPLTRDDLHPVFKILSDRETVAGRSFAKRTVQESDAWLLKRQMDQLEHGISMWAVDHKRIGLIGLCGFFIHGKELEIGYVIKFDYQGQGFGAEAASAALAAACDAGWPVFATIRPSNATSIRVAEKIGLARSDGEQMADLAMYRASLPLTALNVTDR